MKIHEQAKIRAARADDAVEQIHAFREYLHGPKFAGHDARDGMPNNYIHTNEVLARLRSLEDMLTGIHDDFLSS